MDSHRKSIKKTDVILICLLLIIGVVILLVLNLKGKEAGKAIVRVEGNVIETLDLKVDTNLEIESKSGKNTLVIKDGQAWIADATCPDKLCEKMGKISRGGQSIVCLPNKVVVEINNEADGLDAVTGIRP